ncbi:type I iodothyronine deiodinase isoform X3 [Cetorhinus maximus]
MGKWAVYVETLTLVLYLCVQTLIGKVMLLFFPETVKRFVLKMGLKTTMSQNPKFKYEDWGPTFFTFRFVKVAARHLLMNCGDEAFKGLSAPNTRVIDLENKEHKVLDFVKDGWAFENNVDIKQHQTLSDRFDAARLLLNEEPPCPVVVDTMDNVTSAKYAAMPERLYVVLNGKIIYKGERGAWGYKPEEVRLVLQNLS